MNNFIGSLFHWFYCLRIWQTVVLFILATVFVMLINKKLSPKVSKTIFSVALVLWFAVVIYHTLLSRTPGGDYYVKLIPFQSYMDVYNGANRELLRSNYMNIVFYYPGGLLYGMFAKNKKTYIAGIICFCIMSISIEFLQYYLGLGYTETDDVIHNTLGSLIGMLVSQIPDMKTNNNE